MQVAAAALYQIDARQTVLVGDLLRAQVLLDGDRKVGAALDGRIVRDDHARPAVDGADARHDAARRWRVLLIQPFAREGAAFEEGRSRVEQRGDAFARQQFAARAVQVDRLLPAAHHRSCRAFPQLGDVGLHRGRILLEGGRGGVDGLR